MLTTTVYPNRRGRSRCFTSMAGKAVGISILVVVMVLLLGSEEAFAQFNWTKNPGNPIFPGQPGTWYAYVSLSSVLYNADSSRYEMWFTAGAQFEFPYSIGYAWSDNGISWNVYDSNPVLTPTPSEWDAYTTFDPFVLRENGQYKMWYVGIETTALLSRIGYATSPDGINWTKHPSNPVLEPGTASWESAAVSHPSVMPYSNGYKMWYSGSSAGVLQSAIGYATSPDGINWQKDTLNNPVLLPGAGGQWDHLVYGPEVLYMDNLYYMFYNGEIVLYQSDKVGLATSADGLVWTKYPSNPVLQPTVGQWDGSRTEIGSVLMDADTLKMYYFGTNGSNGDIGLATSPFLPDVLLPGTYTVGSGGYFPTIDSAFTKLSTDGIAGNVTLELIDNIYTAPADLCGFRLNGPIPGAGPNSRITIQPAVNHNVTIEGSGQNVLYFLNTSYVTIDGIDITGPTTLTVHSLHTTQYPWKTGIYFVNNSDHNVVQHLIINHENFNQETYGFLSWTESGSATADSNLIQGNFIKQAGVGICVAGKDQNTKAIGNIVRGNQLGSETDSLVTWGIHLAWQQNSIVEDNIIQNIRPNFNYQDTRIILGINTAFGTETIIRNNVVHNIKSNLYRGSAGIQLSGDGSDGAGNGNQVYNNMVYDIQSTSSDYDSWATGLLLFFQNNPEIYYNSVYLSGIGMNHQGSAALYISNNVSGAEIKNNILVNTRDESPYIASAMYDYTSGNLTSDYNDLYCAAGPNNCLVRIGGTNYNTLADWQATGKDLHSISEMPNFTVPYLHIDDAIPTDLDRGATPLTEVTSDFDKQGRHPTTPDIGADEFILTGIAQQTTIPVEFALAQNYPNPFNPSTVISWQLAVGSVVELEVYDLTGRKIMTLLNEHQPAGYHQIEFDASNLASGIYLYRLQAGDFRETRKMVVLK